MEQKRLSTTYKLLRALGFNYSEEEYGDVSLWIVIKQFVGNIYRKQLEKMMDWAILAPQRNLKDYHVGDNAAKVGYRLGEIHIGKGVMVGMETMIISGVTIGDGAVIGSRSTVLKDVPPYTVAMGAPAKVVKEFKQREGSEITEFQE